MTKNKRLKGSIFLKLLFGICLPVIAVFVISYFIVLNTVKKPVTDLTDELLTSKSQTASAEVGGYFSQYMEVTNQMAANSQFESILENTQKGQKITDTAGFDEVFTSLKNVKYTDGDNIEVSWTADFDSSQYTQSDGFTSDETYDITTRQWYKDVQAAKATIVTAPYVDAASKKVIVSAISPVYDSGTKNMIGITGIDFSIDMLRSMMKDLTIGDTGFFMLISSDGTMIYYPDENFQGINITETDLSDNIKAAVQNKQAGTITYTAMGKTVHGYLSVDKNSGYIVVSAMPAAEYGSTAASLSQKMFNTYVGAIALIVVLIIGISLSIIRPIRKLKKAANAIADGQLDISIESRSRDEVGQVSEAFGRTVERLRGYINYINEISTVLDQIADGNLIFELKYDYTGEFSKLKTSLLNIRSTLSEHVSQISTAAHQVYQGSNQVAQGAQSLAQGATEQAGTIQELSATVITIAEQIEKNAEESETASRKATESGAEILRSNEQMKKMINAMAEIKSASDKIGTIINAIDSIAFQTNILALNAAVEAARAGAAGKGFAVVAAEVKNLASKSSESAKNTAELIGRSIRTIQDGMDIAYQTEKALLEAVTSSKDTVEMIDHISAVSVQQAASIVQIKTALEQISSVVQNTSATAEESAAASEELSGQSTMLQELVSQFTYEEDATHVRSLDVKMPEINLFSEKY